MDPLAEKFPGRSPYEYCFSNPINLTDPTGMAPEGGGDGDKPKGKVIALDEVVVTGKQKAVLKPADNTSVHQSRVQNLKEAERDTSGLSYHQKMMRTGAITPMGGIFDIFGFKEMAYTSAFNYALEEDNNGISEASFKSFAIILAIVSKGKAKTSKNLLVASNVAIKILDDCVGSWLTKVKDVSKISNGCEKIADKAVKDLGNGAQYLQVTPALGNQLGGVMGQNSGWAWHVAAFKNGKVYDKLTGPNGMNLMEYKKLFDESAYLNFIPVTTRTLK